jgi:hypothetical protein
VEIYLAMEKLLFHWAKEMHLTREHYQWAQGYSIKKDWIIARLELSGPPLQQHLQQQQILLPGDPIENREKRDFNVCNVQRNFPPLKI